MSRRSEYQKYLESAHWRNLRELKFQESGKACQHCAATDPIRVHHINYRNLTDCETRDLAVLCEPCHQDLHCAMRIQGLKSCEVEGWQLSGVIKWYRTTTDGQKKAARRVTKNKRRAERSARLKAIRIVCREIGRLLQVGRNSKESIDRAIDFLQWYRKTMDNEQQP